MKKIFAWALILLLALSFVACGEGTPTDAPPTAEPKAFFGDWYNSAGRKLQIKEDGTYLLAHEAEGGTWKKQSDTLLECTDAYGVFSVTVSETAVTFGPYGEFHRATKEELALFEKAQFHALASLGVFKDGHAAANTGKKSVFINEDGLALSVPEKDAGFQAQFFGNLYAGSDCAVEIFSGSTVASGSVIGKNNTHIALLKKDLNRSVAYAVLDTKGNMVTDWTPIPIQGNESGRYAYSDPVYANSAGGILICDDAQIKDENGNFIYIYYFVNPLTNQKFRIESHPGHAGTFYLESGMAFYSSEPGKHFFAPDWTSPATAVEYSNFRISEDGTISEIAPLTKSDLVQGDWFIRLGCEETEGKTIFTHAFTGKTFSLDLPSEQMRVCMTDHYCAVSYMNKEKTERYFATYDFEGNILCAPMKENAYTMSGALKHQLDLTYFEDGTFLLEKESESREYFVYNAKGELLISPDTMKISAYVGNGKYLVDGKCVDADGRILIPGITFLPFR